MIPVYPMIPNLMKLAGWNDEPPTVYSLLESYVNYGKDDKTKIKDLARAGRRAFFDFEYPLTNLISKEDFETMILNHFLMRRIGYETVTSFKIALNVKLNEIMPNFNKLFEALDGWHLFDGENYERDLTRNNTGESESHNTSNSDGTTNSTMDHRFSNTPQNKIQDVKDGAYVNEYSYDQDGNTTESKVTSDTSNNSNDNTVEHETSSKSVGDKMRVYQEFLQNRANVYTMIFKELDPLFYQLA